MKLASDETHVQVDGFELALFPQLIGRTPELDDLDSLFTMGRFVARIHAVGARAASTIGNICALRQLREQPLSA